MSTGVSFPAVRRVRKVTGVPVKLTEQSAQQVPWEQDSYRGFGSIPGETPDEFHDRMFDLNPVEAMIYEMEFATRVSSC